MVLNRISNESTQNRFYGTRIIYSQYLWMSQGIDEQKQNKIGYYSFFFLL